MQVVSDSERSACMHLIMRLFGGKAIVPLASSQLLLFSGLDLFTAYGHENATLHCNLYLAETDT